MMGPSKRLAVVAATDDGFAFPTAVMVASLGTASAPGRALDLYILDGGMTSATVARFERALSHVVDRARQRGVDLQPVRIKPNVDSVSALTTHAHLSASTYLRLLIPDLLPPTTGRVLYLDGDIVVCRDVGELFGLDLGGAPAAAAPNVTKPTIGANMRSHAERGLDPSATYVNAGVMVLDLDRWRADGLGSAVLEDLRKHEHLYQFHDQCGLNAVLQNQWAPLPPEWNVQTGSPATKSSPPPLSAVAALHFTGRHKPWHVAYGSEHMGPPVYNSYRRAWLGAARQSGWYSGMEWTQWRCTLAAKEAWLRLHRKKEAAVRAVKTRRSQ